MKYLLIVLLFVSPLFATLPEAKEVRDNSDKINVAKFKNQIPALLKQIEREIWQRSNLGFYWVSVSVKDYDDFTINKVCDILNEEGYYTSLESDKYFGQSLFIGWQ